MTQRDKYRLLALIAGVALLLLFLAAAMARIKMQPGDPFPLEWQQAPQGESAPFGNGYWFLILIRGLLVISVIIIPIYIIINLLTPAGRRRLVKGLIQLLVFLLIMYIISNLTDSMNKKKQVEPEQQGNFELGPGGPTPEGLVPTATQEVTNPSPWLDAGICIGLAVILAIIITVLAWGIYRASKARTGEAIARLADEAQQAVDALQAGGNIRDTVIRCYIQMTQVLAEERQLRRDEAMTPHEFEQILLNKIKLPETPVRHLTSLFEAVRYGDYHPGKREELEAIDSLSAIAAACKSAKA